MSKDNIHRTAWGSYRQGRRGFTASWGSSPLLASITPALVALLTGGVLFSGLFLVLATHLSIPLALLGVLFSLCLSMGVVVLSASILPLPFSFQGQYRGGPLEAFLEAGNSFATVQEEDELFRRAQLAYTIAQELSLSTTQDAVVRLFGRKFECEEDLQAASLALSSLEEGLERVEAPKEEQTIESKRANLQQELAPALVELTTSYSYSRPLAELAHSNDLR